MRLDDLFTRSVSTDRSPLGTPSDSFLQSKLEEQMGIREKKTVNVYVSEYGNFEVDYVFKLNGKKYISQKCSKCGKVK